MRALKLEPRANEGLLPRGHSSSAFKHSRLLHLGDTLERIFLRLVFSIMKTSHCLCNEWQQSCSQRGSKTALRSGPPLLSQGNQDQLSQREKVMGMPGYGDGN